MTRKASFWGALALVALLSVAFAVAFFSRAFPIINIDLRMNRQGALVAARELAQRHGWGPPGFRQAADFNVDTDVQDYVELEAGGKDAFARMIREGTYSPYTWTVRHFREGEQTETYLVFTPEGVAYGFRESLPERQPGRNLAARAARKIAETAAMKEWKISFDDYALVEESEELKVGGRRDHTFIYERKNRKIGAGTYRLRLGVGGDRLTEVRRFVKVPEAFDRRFREMRSANNTIAAVTDVIAGILYVLGGCVIGLFLLMRQRWVLWKQPLALALVIAGLQTLAGVNSWPMEWMDYDTAISYSGFMLDHVLSLAYRFIGDFALLGISFMAAESLTRKAFPEHIQLWKTWSPVPGASVQVLGRTLSGYLLVAVFCAYQVLLYYITARFPGWWTPTDTLIEPNIFAAYFPWFNSFAPAIHAGFWEESLFRAVPIASGALIGAHFGNRRRGIVIALFAQALIFGAAHANYPNFPSYARLVELLLPSLGFGMLYIAFGLLPGIILHFSFDAVWMSLPFFISTAPGVWLDRLLIVASVLIPLWIVFYRRIKAGRWEELGGEFRNAAWQAPPRPEAAAAAEIPEAKAAMTKRSRVVLLSCGVAGLALWLSASSFTSVAPPLAEPRNWAIAAARNALAAGGAQIAPPWQPLTVVNGAPDYPDRFVWQQGGETAYRQLMNDGYLFPPLWLVRFVRFEGDVAARAEEYQALIAGKGTVFGTARRIPESRPGAALPLPAAQALATKAVTARYAVDPATLVLISATPFKLPSRQNWEFVFARPQDNPLKDGQTRITVTIDGDEVTQVYKSVYVPDDWRRAERNRLNFLGILQSASGIVTIILFIAGLVVGVAGWSRRRFSRALFMKFFGVMFVLQAIGSVNGWPRIAGRFATSEPFWNQALVAAGYALVAALFIALNVALINGFVERWRRSQAAAPDVVAPLAGLGAGALLAGVFALIGSLERAYGPAWPRFDLADSIIPVVGIGAGALGDFLKQGTVFLLLFAVFDRMTDGGQKRIALFVAAAFFMGVSLAGSRGSDSLVAWAASGLALALALVAGYLFIFRYQLSLVPQAVAGLTSLSLARQGAYNAFAGALPGYAFAAVLVLLAGWYWYRLLNSAPGGESAR